MRRRKCNYQTRSENNIVVRLRKLSNIASKIIAYFIRFIKKRKKSPVPLHNVNNIASSYFIMDT